MHAVDCLRIRLCLKKFGPLINVKHTKLLKKRLDLVVPLDMKIGPCSCTNNLPMEAMAVNLDYLVTAALWP